MKVEQTECSETCAYKLQTPGNYPKENIQHTEHSESLKSRRKFAYTVHTELLVSGLRGLFTLLVFARP